MTNEEFEKSLKDAEKIGTLKGCVQILMARLEEVNCGTDQYGHDTVAFVKSHLEKVGVKL